MDHPREIESDLVDVLDLSLDQLAALPDNVLRSALHRVLLAPDSETQLFAMFQDSL
ncbi:FxSxx-COOH cyclophane-containing RiPP peptide [Actinophytocola sediminis]